MDDIDLEEATRTGIPSQNDVNSSINESEEKASDEAEFDQKSSPIQNSERFNLNNLDHVDGPAIESFEDRSYLPPGSESENIAGVTIDVPKEGWDEELDLDSTDFLTHPTEEDKATTKDAQLVEERVESTEEYSEEPINLSEATVKIGVAPSSESIFGTNELLTKEQHDQNSLEYDEKADNKDELNAFDQDSNDNEGWDDDSDISLDSFPSQSSDPLVNVLPREDTVSERQSSDEGRSNVICKEIESEIVTQQELSNEYAVEFEEHLEEISLEAESDVVDDACFDESSQTGDVDLDVPIKDVDSKMDTDAPDSQDVSNFPFSSASFVDNSIKESSSEIRENYSGAPDDSEDFSSASVVRDNWHADTREVIDIEAKVTTDESPSLHDPVISTSVAAAQNNPDSESCTEEVKHPFVPDQELDYDSFEKEVVETQGVESEVHELGESEVDEQCNQPPGHSLYDSVDEQRGDFPVTEDKGWDFEFELGDEDPRSSTLNEQDSKDSPDIVADGLIPEAEAIETSNDGDDSYGEYVNGTGTSNLDIAHNSEIQSILPDAPQGDLKEFSEKVEFPDSQTDDNNSNAQEQDVDSLVPEVSEKPASTETETSNPSDDSNGAYATRTEIMPERMSQNFESPISEDAPRDNMDELSEMAENPAQVEKSDEETFGDFVGSPPIFPAGIEDALMDMDLEINDLVEEGHLSHTLDSHPHEDKGWDMDDNIDDLLPEEQCDENQIAPIVNADDMPIEEDLGATNIQEGWEEDDLGLEDDVNKEPQEPPRQEDIEEELRQYSPPQQGSWMGDVFSGLQNIKTKTSAGLEKIYEVLDADLADSRDGSVVSGVSSTKGGSVNKFKGLFDRFAARPSESDSQTSSQSNSPVKSIPSTDCPNQFKALFSNLSPSSTNPISPRRDLLADGFSVLGKIGTSTLEIAVSEFQFIFRSLLF